MSPGPHAIVIAWGEEEQSPRLSRHARVAARLSGFRDDEKNRPSVTPGQGLRRLRKAGVTRGRFLSHTSVRTGGTKKPSPLSHLLKRQRPPSRVPNPNIFCGALPRKKSLLPRKRAPLGVRCSAAAGDMTMNSAEFMVMSPHAPPWHWKAAGVTQKLGKTLKAARTRTPLRPSKPVPLCQYCRAPWDLRTCGNCAILYIAFSLSLGGDFFRPWREYKQRGVGRWTRSCGGV